ncbi:hypothetical protein TEA_024331 [Camellia sinensis var. sinensis]|uniref:Ubiquinol oxidase n=1 Tax=Camellia sinensis var. sinensis TaxID=542762 RepID=A0A4S4ENV4_CAMSN|nr:hypothetical protein TEA_024331 [Camellia sinensis var. sinensis]
MNFTRKIQAEHLETILGEMELRERLKNLLRFSTKKLLHNPKMISKPEVRALDGEAQAVLEQTMKETYKSDLSIDLKKHHVPVTFLDKIAYWTVKALRYPTDVFFQKSLRWFEYSGGWIKTLLDEAENEGIHLMTLMEVAKPRWYECALMFTVQGVFFNAYFLAYLILPKTGSSRGWVLGGEGNSFLHFLKELDKGNTENVPAPAITIDYCQLPPDSTLHDVVMVVRADEAHHRDVNHFVSVIIFSFLAYAPLW